MMKDVRKIKLYELSDPCCEEWRILFGKMTSFGITFILSYPSRDKLDAEGGDMGGSGGGNRSSSGCGRAGAGQLSTIASQVGDNAATSTKPVTQRHEKWGDQCQKMTWYISKLAMAAWSPSYVPYPTSSFTPKVTESNFSTAAVSACVHSKLARCVVCEHGNKL